MSQSNINDNDSNHTNNLNGQNVNNSTNETEIITYKKVITFLAERFPKCFSVEGEAKPLKIGIFQDLIKELEKQPPADFVISNTKLRKIIKQYTSNWRYLHGCKKDAFRVDLYGNEDIKVDEQHVTHAIKALKESKIKFNKNLTKNKLVRKNENTKLNKYHSNNKKNATITSKINSNKISIKDLHKGMKIKVNEFNQIGRIIDFDDKKIQVQLLNGIILHVKPEQISDLYDKKDKVI